MDLDFTEEQEMLRDLVRSVCAEHAPLEVVRACEDDAKGFPEALWKGVAELGVLSLATPEGDGGAGELVASMEALGSRIALSREAGFLSVIETRLGPMSMP